jgi:hypothetical protein
MSFQKEARGLLERVVSSLNGIKAVPGDLLPHTVFVEEEQDGEPVYNRYQLTKLLPNGKCVLYNPKDNLSEERDLSEIGLDWLITIWNWYLDLSGESGPEPEPEPNRIIPNSLERALRLLLDAALHEIPCFEQSHTFAVCTGALGDDGLVEENGDARMLPEQELSVFLYPLEHFERNVTDDEILSGWADGYVEKYTPDEFAELINDESFADREYWVRFIKC